MHIKYLLVEREGILNEISPDGEDNKKMTKDWVDYLRTHEKYAVNPSKKKKNKSNLELCFK